MEIKITTKQVLGFLQILAWIIFVGLCINAGALIFNLIFTLFVNPSAANNLFLGIDLSSILTFNKTYFITLLVIMSITLCLKSILFYLIVLIFHNKKIDFSKPFNESMKKFIFNSSYVSIGIGLFSYWGMNFVNFLESKKMVLPELNKLEIGGADVWIFMGIILFVIAQFFKRGLEIQSENDLTI